MKKLILLLFIPLVSFGQTPITDDNFYQAIETCLSTNPVDGMCSDSEYGAMPDWDVSQVTNMSNAFDYKVDFNGDISAWDVSSVTNMFQMFFAAEAFNQPIGDWDVSSVTYMVDMFKYTYDFNQDISNWNVSSVTDFGGMFRNTSAFNQPIGNWDVSSVTSTKAMFEYAYAFNQPIGNWDVSNVTDMSYMFRDASAFNQPIGDWDVSNVTNMVSMFMESSAFNQDISSWCVTNIDSEPTGFSIDSILTESNMPVWGTCPSFGLDDQNRLDISIYPNPSSDYISVNIDSELEAVVFDLLGKELIRENISGRLDISSLEKGTYILNLTEGANTSTHKIIKE